MLLLRSDKKDRIQLAIKRMMAPRVISSIIVLEVWFNSFREVSTIKHIPSRLEEAFKMCGDFSLLSFIIIFCSNIMKVYPGKCNWIVI